MISLNSSVKQELQKNNNQGVKEFIIAIGLILFIEGLICALFPSKIKNMTKLIEAMPANNLRILGVVFAIIGFIIIWAIIKLYLKFKNVEAMGFGDAKYILTDVLANKILETKIGLMVGKDVIRKHQKNQCFRIKCNTGLHCIPDNVTPSTFGFFSYYWC